MLCSMDAFENEQHFLIECLQFNEYKDRFFQTVANPNKYFLT